MGFYSPAFLVFLMKESKKRRRKQPGKLMAKSCSQPVNLPGAWPLMNPLRAVYVKSALGQIANAALETDLILSFGRIKPPGVSLSNHPDPPSNGVLTHH